MASYNTLKTTIAQKVYTNGEGEVTAAMVKDALNAMVNSLGAKYQIAGVATPATNPGTPDYNVVYLAATAGRYTNFGNLNVAEREIAILKWVGTWTKDTITVLPEPFHYNSQGIEEEDFTISGDVATAEISDINLGSIVDVEIPATFPLDWEVGIEFDHNVRIYGDVILMISVPAGRTGATYLAGVGGERIPLFPGRMYRIRAYCSSGSWRIIGFESDPESPGLSFFEIGISDWQISGSDAELTLAPEVINGRLVRVSPSFASTPNTATVRFARTPGVNGRCVIEVENGAIIPDFSIEPDEGYTSTIDLPVAKSVYLTCEIINGRVWVTGVTYYDV